jgi:hypothetical protein
MLLYRVLPALLQTTAVCEMLTPQHRLQSGVLILAVVVGAMSLSSCGAMCEYVSDTVIRPYCLTYKQLLQCNRQINSSDHKAFAQGLYAA